MKQITTDWKREELEAYILIYFAHADFEQSEEEENYIKTKVNSTAFNAMQKEFATDNDFQSIQKIVYSVEHLAYSKTEIEQLFKAIKALAKQDGKFDLRESNLMQGLKHVLRG